MCGIAGFYNFRDDKLLKKISRQLSHRGPDGEGFFIDDKVSLLNRRLAIIDRKGGNQPIYNEDHSVVVVYNGEIYNYQDLRRKLISNGHQFQTQSDTEVIVHAWEEWREGCFDRFNGMFAIALYDIKKEKLILARDHFGIKPLYFSIINSNLKSQNSKLHLKSIKLDNLRIIFCSEIRPILESNLIPKKPNDRIIYRYLKFRVHDDQRETFFKGIYRLMPGELMIVQGLKLKVKSYSKLKDKLLNIKEIKKLGHLEITRFRKELIKAIRLRLVSEVPVGSCLSGGIDSSTVVSIVNYLLTKKAEEVKSVGKTQKTFSAVFPDGSNNEEKYIDHLKSQIANLKSYKIMPKPEEFFKEIEKFIKTQEEPTISTGPYAQFKVMEKASKNVTVLLDGQGSDEMLAGYNPYYFVYFRQLWQEEKYGVLIREFFSAFDIVFQFMTSRLSEMLGIKKRVFIDNLLNIQFINRFKKEKFSMTNDHLKKRLVEDIFSNSLQSLLRYEDRNSMRFSIEGRVPFLDLNLIKYFFSLPDQAIINGGWNKFILRKAVKDFLPALIVKRRNKIGFTTPEYQWFMRMKNRIYQLFLSPSFAQRKYFNQKEILKAFQLFIEGKVDDTMVFWRLINLEIWLRIFFDKKTDKNLKSLQTYEFGKANPGKKIKIKVEGKTYFRYPIRTGLFKKGDDYVGKIVNHIKKGIDNLLKIEKLKNKKFFLVVSEKIVAIAQGRSFFLWEIKPSFWAKLLSKFVTKTPYGIGLGSPWTMELAIKEVGLERILLATIISFFTKILGIKGVFYQIAGKEVAAIDGPTEYSLYPSNVSAKLGPKDPQKVAEKIKSEIVDPKFLGAVIIDANDLGQKVLGNSTNLDNKLIEKIFSDNPMGQADEQTPLTLVVI